jgi:uncharacterized membrane protein
MFLRSYVLLGIIALLAIVSISIVWLLFAADYPTHSDVFFMGVEAGVLAAVLLVCLVLIGFFLYRLIVLPKRALSARTRNSYESRTVTKTQRVRELKKRKHARANEDRSTYKGNLVKSSSPIQDGVSLESICYAHN